VKRIVFALLLLSCRTEAPAVSPTFCCSVASMLLGSILLLLPPIALQQDPWQKSLWDYRHSTTKLGKPPAAHKAGSASPRCCITDSECCLVQSLDTFVCLHPQWKFLCTSEAHQPGLQSGFVPVPEATLLAGLPKGQGRGLSVFTDN